MKYLVTPYTADFRDINKFPTQEERNTSLLFRIIKERTEQIYFDVWIPIAGRFCNRPGKLTDGSASTILHVEGQLTKYVKGFMMEHTRFNELFSLN